MVQRTTHMAAVGATVAGAAGALVWRLAADPILGALTVWLVGAVLALAGLVAGEVAWRYFEMKRRRGGGRRV